MDWFRLSDCVDSSHRYDYALLRQLSSFLTACAGTSFVITKKVGMRAEDTEFNILTIIYRVLMMPAKGMASKGRGFNT